MSEQGKLQLVHDREPFNLNGHNKITDKPAGDVSRDRVKLLLPPSLMKQSAHL